MQYKNSEILAAVLNKFLQPLVQQFAATKMSSIPFMQIAENKVKSWGIVSPNWSLTNELMPFIEPVTRQALTPMIKSYLSNIPDESIPQMIHSIVDKGLEQGGISLMEGRLQIDNNDLQELKKLLNYNLPLVANNEYEVKFSEETNNGTETSTDSQQTI